MASPVIADPVRSEIIVHYNKNQKALNDELWTELKKGELEWTGSVAALADVLNRGADVHFKN